MRWKRNKDITPTNFSIEFGKIYDSNKLQKEQKQR